MVRTENGGDGSPKKIISVLQPMFYGVRPLSATRAFRVDGLVELIDVSLEEGDVTSA